MYNVVLELLRDYLPSNKDFVIRNLQFLASVRGRGQMLSFVMLLITSTGIFLPLEVALNSIWGFKKNRSYLMNLMVSLGLALACGCLAMLSIALTAQNLRVLGHCDWRSELHLSGVGFVVMKASAIVATICIYFLDLLAAAARQSSSAGGAAGGHHYRPALGSRKVHLHPGAALAEFSGSLRAILGLGHADVLVLLERHAAAGRRISFRRRTQQPGRSSKGDRLGTRCQG